MTDDVTIDNISKFFELSKYNYRVFDMSRTVKRISNQRFKRIETQQEVYPTPFQQHAWLGILFWHPETANSPAIWFLKFPIDELGFMKLEARDAFIQEMLEQVGEKIKQDNSDAGASDSKHESGYAFKPQQDKMAIFNSLATRELGQAPSKYYEHASEYIQGKLGYDQWSFLGFQGLADVAANLQDDDNMRHMTDAIGQMPEQPLVMFSQLLEHVESDKRLSQALLDRLDQEIQAEEPNITLAASLTRGLSATELRDESIRHLLDSPLISDIEILATITSRAWESLKDPQFLQSYLEALATQEQQSFDVILMELLPIPDMRDAVLGGLRNPERTEQLSERIGGFMQRFK